MVNEAGDQITDPRGVCDVVADHFEALFTATPYMMHDDLFDHYPEGVDSVADGLLCSIPTTDEVKQAINHLSDDSAPGVDGFTGYFFRGCWDIIQSDVMEMIEGFFKGDYLHHRVTATLLTLIPEVPKPRSLLDFETYQSGDVL